MNEKPLEPWMKCKSTRSSRKTLEVAPLVCYIDMSWDKLITEAKHRVSIGLKQSALVQTTLRIRKQRIWRQYKILSGFLRFQEPNPGLNYVRKSAKIFRK